METERIEESIAQRIPTKEKWSYALTNSGQTMIYALYTTFLMIFMTDYLYIAGATAGIILGASRIFDAINDPIMGQILDKTNTKWGKCRPYMLFTPIPLAIISFLIFMPLNFNKGASIAYITIMYLIFTMIYTANDIPYWSMSSVITTDPNERAKLVPMTRLIGGFGSALTVGAFWTINKIASDAGMSYKASFFIAAALFIIIGTILMLQGFFNTKERAKKTINNEPFFSNLKLIPKSKPLVINLISGMLMSVMMIGGTAMTTYFVKWNMKAVFPDMASNSIMSIFTPLIGILPALAMIIGLLLTPTLLKKYEKRTLLLVAGVWGIIANLVFYFVGYTNIYIFILGRFLAFLPLGLWSCITTLMIGDSVDDIEFRTGKRVEGTCFSLLTFIGKFQNGVNVALTGMLLSLFAYNGTIDADVGQQSDKALKGIFIMVTLIPAIGYLLMSAPFFFYDFTNAKHLEILKAIKERNKAMEE